MKQKKTSLVVTLLILSILMVIYIITIKPFGDNLVRFEIIKQIFYSPTQRVDIENLDGYIVRSSKDGVAMLNVEGVTIWNKTFNIERPTMKKSGNYIAVGDITGQDIYLFNKEGFLHHYRVNYPIILFEINMNGILAVVGEKNDGHIIQIFDSLGKELVIRRTYFKNDGYPLSLALSDDGMKMATSFLFVHDNSIKTNISFFNFSDLGKNFSERIVGGYMYDNTIIPDLEFLENNYIVAIGDDRLLFYKMDIKPKLVKEVAISNIINKVAYTDDKVLILFGKAFEATDKSYENIVISYSKQGKQMDDYHFESKIQFLQSTSEDYYIADELSLRAYDKDGKAKWKTNLEKEIIKIVPLDNNLYGILYNNTYKIVNIVR